MFEQFKFKRIYRTQNDEIDKNLLIPLLQHSLIYDRGTGFFTVDALSDLAKGIIPLIKKKAIIRIITSVELGEKEQILLTKGYQIAEETLKNKIIEDIDSYIENDSTKLNLDLITNLIAAGLLQIKVAYIPEGGIYHEKIGFFRDSENNIVCFIGSVNETYSGYKKNLESISLIKSWDSEEDKKEIQEQQKYFNDLWNDNNKSVRTYIFPEAAERKLINRFKKSNSVDEAILNYASNASESINNEKKEKKLYPYQERAISYFCENNFCCFYEMATGTGKTFTSVKTILKLFEIKKSLFVVILVPQVDLQLQWEKALVEQNIKPYLFGGEASLDFNETLDRSIIDYCTTNQLVVSVCVYDTYFGKLSTSYTKLKGNKLIIVDEAHELSRNQINLLPKYFEYRLGLSATPERHNQSEIDDILFYFMQNKKETFKYTIEQAIEAGFLSKYEYHPIFIHFTDKEFTSFKSISKAISVEYNQPNPDKEKIKDLLNTRSRIIKKAENKIEKLKEMLSSGNQYNFKNSVIYCGQGKDSNEIKIIDSVTIALEKANLIAHQFTSETEDREKVLQEFENNFFDVLVAIKCFDQGVDVPKLDKIYIMASDSLKRQTIQRRGRVLRVCKETGKTLAYIYDMVVLPPDLTDKVGGKSLILSEFRRVREYLRLSENKLQYKYYIENIEDKFDIKESDYERTQQD